MVQRVLIRAIIVMLLAGAGYQPAFAEENTMLKSRLYKPPEPRQFEKESLLSTLLYHSTVYEYLLGNPHFVKIQDMTTRLWDKHTQTRKYRYYMRDDFIQRD